MSAKKTSLVDRKALKCICGGTAKETLLSYKGFKLRGWKCSKCSEEITDPRDFNAYMELKRKQKLKVKVGKLGNSLVLRIPKAIQDLHHIRKGEELIISSESQGKFTVRV